jgi:hypothetical protein
MNGSVTGGKKQNLVVINWEEQNFEGQIRDAILR